MFSILRPYIFNLDPEVAHDLAIKSLKFNLIPETFFKVEGEEILKTNFLGTNINNPIGLAAGFDKSAEVYNSLFRFGFGFVEVGTVTPKRQLGNQKPRIFRLVKDKGLINRLGFNNHGIEVVTKRILQKPPNGTLGINIGPNKDTKEKVEDFIICLEKIHNLASYITINISSPNTEGLRDFHKKDLMFSFLKKISEYKNRKKITKPILIKISPDISDTDISNIMELILKFKIDGIIISNTTNNRENLTDPKKNEEGGLSGLPLKKKSTTMIKKFYKYTKKKIPIIGVGGIDSGESAFEKISSGASVVQLYTGMVYKGPTIVKEIKKDLISILKKEKISSISEAIGINT